MSRQNHYESLDRDAAAARKHRQLEQERVDVLVGLLPRHIAKGTTAIVSWIADFTNAAVARTAYNPDDIATLLDLTGLGAMDLSMLTPAQRRGEIDDPELLARFIVHGAVGGLRSEFGAIHERYAEAALAYGEKYGQQAPVTKNGPMEEARVMALLRDYPNVAGEPHQSGLSDAVVGWIAAFGEADLSALPTEPAWVADMLEGTGLCEIDDSALTLAERSGLTNDRDLLARIIVSMAVENLRSGHGRISTPIADLAGDYKRRFLRPRAHTAPAPSSGRATRLRPSTTAPVR